MGSYQKITQVEGMKLINALFIAYTLRGDYNRHSAQLFVFSRGQGLGNVQDWLNHARYTKTHAGVLQSKHT